MKNNQTNLFLPLDIQHFADDSGAVATDSATATAVPTTANNSNGVNYDDVFKKLDSILDKRSEGIAKSALKDNGYQDDELKDILTQYRASKQAKTQEVDTKVSTLEQENASLKASIQQEKLNNEALTQARSLGIEEKNIPYLIKLADLKGAIDDKGAITPDKIKTALETVLNDVPAFKKEDKGTAGVTVGANTSTSSQPSGSLFGFNFEGVRKH